MKALNALIHRLGPFSYRLLLTSSVLIIVSGLLTSQNLIHDLLSNFVISLTIISGIVLLRDKTSKRIIFFKSIGLLCIPLQYISLIVDFEIIRQVFQILYILFFIVICFNLYKDIYTAKDINLEIVAGVLCGFIILGILVAFLFALVNSVNPGSFNGISEVESNFDNFVYFSFSTLLTFGFGDITANTGTSRTLVVLIGLIGYFYTVIATAIIIGKYIANTRKTN